jgi:hypothetical protein
MACSRIARVCSIHARHTSSSPVRADTTRTVNEPSVHSVARHALERDVHAAAQILEGGPDQRERFRPIVGDGRRTRHRRHPDADRCPGRGHRGRRPRRCVADGRGDRAGPGACAVGGRCDGAPVRGGIGRRHQARQCGQPGSTGIGGGYARGVPRLGAARAGQHDERHQQPRGHPVHGTQREEDGAVTHGGWAIHDRIDGRDARKVGMFLTVPRPRPSVHTPPG